MTTIAKSINAAYWLALTVWVSVLIAAGVSATSTFTTLPDPELGLRLEKFEAFDGERHGHIAAGMVMEPIFTFVDLIQLAAGGMALVMFVLQCALLGMSWQRPANAIRGVCLVIAMGLFLSRAALITPQMNQDLRMYWQAAESGDAETARAARESFDAGHRRARPMFDTTLVLLLIGVGASAAAWTSPLNHSPRRRESALEPPSLLNTNR